MSSSPLGAEVDPGLNVLVEPRIPRDTSRLEHLTSSDLDLDVPAGYESVLRNLQTAASRLMYVFPEAYTYGVEQGAQTLFANSLYAVNSHLNNGSRTDARLPLNGNADNCLELKLEDDEPLVLLNHLAGGIDIINDTLKDPDTKVTKVNEDPEFYLYRFWRPGETKNNLSVYIRPEGAETYDNSLEYGRNGEGVEASISFVVDTVMEDREVIELGPHRTNMPDNRISIRLDREGVLPDERGKSSSQRDPTQAQGTLSLDVGSVLGRDDWLGTKIGRFLAFGDMLRREGTGSRTGLNHATHFFTSTDGQAEWFAQDARRLIAEMEDRRLDMQDIEKFSGGLALATA